MIFDKIVIGAGIYGLYSALYCAKKNEKILVIECDSSPFERATYINQARVHMGYHYPRSLSTAVKSKDYFERFNEDFGFCINKEFNQVYATSQNLGWTSAEQFKKFCKDADIPCINTDPSNFFKDGMCDGAFETKEYTYDAQILKKWFLNEISNYPNVTLLFDSNIREIKKNYSNFTITLTNNDKFSTGFLINASYASVNQIHSLLGFKPLEIKYELCEIILCEVNPKLKETGITVMDGPFFSIMPFGKTRLHSLTSVTFTPHITCVDSVPNFDCQARSLGYCSEKQLGNCNSCTAKPKSAWEYMSHLATKYLKDDFSFKYASSLFSMKPILKSSEIDDSRPTTIRTYSEAPKFISVLSGKINTVYELDKELST